MPQGLTITDLDVIHQVKLSQQIPSIVEAIATQKVIVEAAQQAGIEVEPEELQLEGDKLRLEHKLVKAKDTWDWLKKHHLSLSEFEKLVHNNVLSKKLANHFFSSYVEKFFYQNKLDYIAAATYEVVLEDRDLALEIFYALEEGEITFQEVARQYILDPELRRAGGYQGVHYRKEFRPEIAAAVFAAAAPEVLKPITNSKGIYLILVEEIIQPQLDEKLQQQIISELFAEWLKQQIDCLEIVTTLDNGNLQVQAELLKQA